MIIYNMQHLWTIQHIDYTWPKAFFYYIVCSALALDLFSSFYSINTREDCEQQMAIARLFIYCHQQGGTQLGTAAEQ